MIFGKKKKLLTLRKQWGKPIERFRNLDLISSYHQIVSSKTSNEYVDGKTWADLNFDSIFNLLDRNTSVIGQQYLYHLMHKYEKDESVLKNRFELTKRLKNDSSLREEIQLHLLQLNETGSYFIPNIILDDNLPFTKYYVIFYLVAYLPVLFSVLLIFNGVFLFAILGSLVLNVVLNKIFSKKIYKYFSGFSGLNTLIIVARNLSGIKTGKPVEELKYLMTKKNMLKKLSKKIGYLVLDKESMNEMIAITIDYMNMIFLFDIIAYYRSVHILRKSQSYMSEVYEVVANLDVSISIASYLEELPCYSNPIFSDEKKIGFEKMYHPLIKDAVPNSISGLDKSVLITGSNMSGKTTFIKTIGVNAILSQTLYFSLSEKFLVPRFFVKSSIKKEEDLENNKSYFFVEVEELQNFIEFAGNNGSYIFLIDEIFRGTNTVERLAASTAVLKYLDNNNIIFVTTHDIELQDLLQNEFQMLHFSEQIEGNKYYFDYKIHQGPCKTRNAIKLLEIKNYPDSIIQEANSIAIKLSK